VTGVNKIEKYIYRFYSVANGITNNFVKFEVLSL